MCQREGENTFCVCHREETFCEGSGAGGGGEMTFCVCQGRTEDILCVSQIGDILGRGNGGQ